MIAKKCRGVTDAHAYLEYAEKYRIYVLKLDIRTAGNISADEVMSFFSDNSPEKYRPAKINIISEEEILINKQINTVKHSISKIK